MGSGFNLKIKIHKSNQIIKDHGLDENGRVTRHMRDEIDRLMNPFVPLKDGTLRRLKNYPSNSKIKYISPYAHYQYKGEEYISPSLGVSGVVIGNDRWWSPKGEKKKKSGKKLKYNTPGTGPEWNKLMMNKKGKELINDVQNYIKKGN